jgi:hypothetical protein
MDPLDEEGGCRACRRGQPGCTCPVSEDRDLESLEATPEGQSWAPAFSLEVAQEYARELAETLFRTPMNEGARKAEVKEFARLVMEVYRRQMRVPASPVPAGQREENANA